MIEQQRRQLLQHGFIFLVVAIGLGIATAVLPHARMWLAAHVSAFLTGLILVATGAVWRELRLTTRQRSVTFGTGFLAAYVGLIANVYSATVNLPGPATSPGVPMPAAQAAIFFPMIAVLIASTLASFGLVAYGLRGNPQIGNGRSNPEN
jgi:hypothetical protein